MFQRSNGKASHPSRVFPFALILPRHPQHLPLHRLIDDTYHDDNGLFGAEKLPRKEIRNLFSLDNTLWNKFYDRNGRRSSNLVYRVRAVVLDPEVRNNGKPNSATVKYISNFLQMQEKCEG